MKIYFIEFPDGNNGNGLIITTRKNGTHFKTFHEASRYAKDYKKRMKDLGSFKIREGIKGE